MHVNFDHVPRGGLPRFSCWNGRLRWTDTEGQKGFFSRSPTVVAHRSGQPIGLLLYETGHRELYVNIIWVHYRYRRRGIAQQMIEIASSTEQVLCGEAITDAGLGFLQHQAIHRNMVNNVVDDRG